MGTVPHTNLDPEVADAAPLMAQLLGSPEPLTVDGIPAFRDEIAQRIAAMPAPPVEPTPNVISEDRLVPGLDGDPDVRVRVHRPANQTAPPHLRGAVYAAPRSSICTMPSSCCRGSARFGSLPTQTPKSARLAQLDGLSTCEVQNHA